MHTDRVVWSEGMFLQPQHFQQQARHVEHLVESRVRAVAGCGWGFSALAIDASQLASGKLALAAARGVLPDGTPFDLPGHDAAPEALDIGPQARDAPVLLALPLARPGLAEASLHGDAAGGLARYAVADYEAADATDAARSAPIQVGRARLRLLPASEPSDAYSCLAVARVVERRPDGQVVLDRGFIAPALSVRDQPALAAWTRELCGLLHQRGQMLAARLAQPGPGGVAEIANFLWLQTVNRFEPVFGHLAQAPQLHPERLYAACLMLAGDLATFTREPRRPAAFAPYRHDDLQATFAPLVADLRRSLSMEPDTSAVAIALQERKSGLRVAVVPDRELLRTAGFVLAVGAQMPPEALRARFAAQSKLGPVERIRDLVDLQLPGIGLHALPVAPRQIPFHAGFHYYELDRSGELWAQLDRSGGLAVHVAGDFPGLALELWAIRR